MEPYKKKLNSNKLIFQRGVTLVEILIAFLILAVAVLPVVAVFSKYYGVSSKQLDQESALKIAEAAMNEILSARFSSLDGGVSFSIPLNLETPAGTFPGTFNFSGNTGSSNDIKIGPNTYKLTATTHKVFTAQNPLQPPNPSALVFRYMTVPDTGPPAVVATYACTDDMISVKMDIEYGKYKNKLSIITFRADMSK